ncbi:MAG TPA: proline--tRNA ligase [Caldimonas sp.]|nr:proline--tRNA ligase [Caldimonas sp.]HEX2540903.1 proline--tRNA ligase [Caldimonas sp.]
MKASQFFVSTLKEAPADAEVKSHQLMLRAGFIKRLSAGIYTYMPMGLRVIRKVEAIVREEMDRAGAVELLMPVVQPAELWQESGRFQKYGPELMRVKDRHDRDFVIQPTSEEVITDIARQELRSYRALPRNFYHIQTKFRDERRPRFGVMRGREFTMKDAYSFDRDLDGARASYDRMYAAYVRIFERMGLVFRPVAADNGTIGGIRSHEFQVIAETGEDAIVYCPGSDYAANMEMAEAVAPAAPRGDPSEPLTKTPTPGKSTCEDVAALLGVPLTRTVKSLVLATDAVAADGAAATTTLWLLLVRGDHEMNEVKAGKLPGFGGGFRFATAAEIEAHFGSPPGYLGPIGMNDGVKLVVDRTVAAMSDFICGANEVDYHYTGVNWGRDLPQPGVVADIRNVVEGDPSPDGQGPLAIQRGIEVGHVFLLGSYYSQSMDATYLDEAGKAQLLQMGCYGIGITRIVGAAVEQNHDARGMIWPQSIAPFSIVLCPIGYDRSAAVKEAADGLHAALCEMGVDVLLDDRGERPGAMFADWELVGLPHRVVLSDRGLKAGEVEYQGRRDAAPTTLPRADALPFLKGKLAA